MNITPLPGFAEPFNSWSHLLGAGFFLLSTVLVLLKFRPPRDQALSILVFGFSSVFLLSMSGVYHLLALGGPARQVLRRLDHAGIYVLIAGTFTAVHGTRFTSFLRWGMIMLAWLLAATGISLEMVFFKSFPEFLRLILYIGFGWLGLVSGVVLWRRKGYASMKRLLWGGVAYTVGALFEFFGREAFIPGVFGPHELFHVAVLAGLGLHWLFVLEPVQKKKARSVPA